MMAVRNHEIVCYGAFGTRTLCLTNTSDQALNNKSQIHRRPKVGDGC